MYLSELSVKKVPPNPSTSTAALKNLQIQMFQHKSQEEKKTAFDYDRHKHQPIQSNMNSIAILCSILPSSYIQHVLILSHLIFASIKIKEAKKEYTRESLNLVRL